MKDVSSIPVSRVMCGGVLYLNPGCAGKPKPGSERSAVILHCSGKEIRTEHFKLQPAV